MFRIIMNISKWTFNVYSINGIDIKIRGTVGPVLMSKKVSSAPAVVGSSGVGSSGDQELFTREKWKIVAAVSNRSIVP